MENKSGIFLKVAKMLSDHGITFSGKDDQRPWGGFYVVNEADIIAFVKLFFHQMDLNDLDNSVKLSPKILIVAPHARLSWQYHHRRSELWSCLEGPVSVMTSDDNIERHPHKLLAKDVIRLKREERHRLIGLDGWGIVAEIWQHTDENNLSDEEDIVRIQDDYGR